MPVAFRSSSPASPELDFECCNVKELRAYLASGGNANRCHDGTTLLYNAARCGDDARVQLLLQSGGHDSLLVKGPNGSYPLHAAACAKAPACISLLMDAHMEKDCQFDPHQLRDSFGYTPLDNAKSDTASLQALSNSFSSRNGLSSSFGSQSSSNDSRLANSSSDELSTGPDSSKKPDTASACNAAGNEYKANGQYDKALEMYSHAVSLLTAEHGGDHPDIARAYNNIASVYITLEQYDRALEMCRKSLAMFKATQGDGHPDIARGYNNMGYVYDQKCEFDRALEMYHRSLQIFVATLGEHHPTVATCYNNMGNVCLSRREYGKAEALYQRSLDIWNLRQDTAQAAALQLAVDEMHRMNSRRRLPHPDSKGRKAGCAVM